MKKLSLENVLKAIDTFHEKVDALDYKLNYSEEAKARAKAFQEKRDAASKKIDKLLEKAEEKAVERLDVAGTVLDKLLKLDEEPPKPGTWQAERAEKRLKESKQILQYEKDRKAREEYGRQYEMNSLLHKPDAESRDRLRQLKEESEKYQDWLRSAEEYESREKR